VYLTQMRRWGQIADDMPAAWYHETAKRVYLPEVYLDAARELVEDGLATEDDFPWDSDGYRPPQTEFIDGITFDGRTPNAYLKQFPIGLKGDQRVVGNGVEG